MDGELSSEEEAELHHTLALSPESRALFREHLTLQGVARDERVLHRPTDDMRESLFARLQSEEGMKPIAAPIVGTVGAVGAATSPTKVAAPYRMDDRAPLAADEDDRTEERRKRRRLIPILIPLMFCVIAGGFWASGGFNSGEGDRSFASAEMGDVDSSYSGANSFSSGEFPASRSETRSEIQADAEQQRPNDSMIAPINRGNGLIAMNEEGTQFTNRSVSARRQRSMAAPELGATVSRSNRAHQTQPSDDSNDDALLAMATPSDLQQEVQESHDVLGNGIVSVPSPASEVIADVERLAVNAEITSANNGFNVRGGRANEASIRRDGIQINDPVRDLNEPASIDITSTYTSIAEDTEYRAELSEEWVEDNNYGRGGSTQHLLLEQGFDGFLTAQVVDSAGQPLRLDTNNYLAFKEHLDTLARQGKLDPETVVAKAETDEKAFSTQDYLAPVYNSIEPSVSIANPSTTLEPTSPTVASKEKFIASVDGKPEYKNTSPVVLSDAVEYRSKDVALDVMSGPQKPVYFVGLEQGVGMSIASERSAGIPTSSFSSINTGDDVSSETRVKFGVAFDGGKHMVFAALGSAIYKKYTSIRSQSTSREIRDVVDPVTLAVHQQVVSTITTLSREEEEYAREFHAGFGYRYSLTFADNWQGGAEAFAGAGGSYFHVGMALPISYKLAKSLRLEFAPGITYKKAWSDGQIVTTGSLDTNAPSSSYEERIETPRDAHGVQAVAGIGLILLLR